MENKSHALAAGAFVLLVTAMLIGLAMWLMRDVTNTRTYEMTSGDAVNGLQVQAPVRYRGVDVGKVTAIGFDPAERGNVLVTMAIAQNAPLGRDTFATLGFQGVTGLSFVQLDDGEHSSGEPMPPGPNGPPRIPLRANKLGALTDRAGEMMDKIGQIADSVQQALGPENQAALARALSELGAAAQSVQQLAASTDKTLQLQFDPKTGHIPHLLRQADTALAQVGNAAQTASEMTAAWQTTAQQATQLIGGLHAPDGVLHRIGQSADALVSGTVPRIQNLADNASRAIDRLEDVATRLDENPQALLFGNGKLPPGPGEAGFTPPPVAAH